MRDWLREGKGSVPDDAWVWLVHLGGFGGCPYNEPSVGFDALVK